MKLELARTFRSLESHNYRLWATGALVSNIGTWMQRTAQDWLVLADLTRHNATAVGIVMALQYGPQMLLLPLTGYAADHFDRRRLLIITQGLMGLFALGLGVLTLCGVAELWHVYLFAFGLGCASAFDAPARQTFVAELVGEEGLPNAVALNSTSFNAARMIGPAVSGVLIAVIGSGWVFVLNALSFAAVLAALMRMRVSELHRRPEGAKPKGGLAEGFRYVSRRPDLIAALAMLFLIGTFGLNFPIFISTMSLTAFHGGASQYGLMTATMAIGSVAGALRSANASKPRFKVLIAAATAFGICCTLAALMPTAILFGLVLVSVGISTQIFNTSSNSLVQISTEPAMRGRVMAILLAIALGATPLGAPMVGWVADHFGPRWALGIGAASGWLAAGVGLLYLRRERKRKALLVGAAPT